MTDCQVVVTISRKRQRPGYVGIDRLISGSCAIFSEVHCFHLATMTERVVHAIYSYEARPELILRSDELAT
jgi:hypothetical protein